MNLDLLNHKRILIVDDEPDVLDTLESLLPMCEVVKATRFDMAKELLESEFFDMAVLDIMGVDGYKLLEIAGRRRVLPVMLTAHALSPGDTVKSFRQGAAYFIPKEKMTEIALYLHDVFEAKEKGKSFWWRWFDRFAAFYDRKFGPHWKELDEEFWNKFGSWQ